MTRDLFGRPISHDARSNSNRQQAPQRPVQPRHVGLAAGPLPSVAQRYYVVGGRSYTREQIYAMVDFDQASKDNPDDEIIVVLDCAKQQPYVYLVQMPRNHPSRLDHLGRQDPAKQPFWRHGEIMHIQRVGNVP